MTNDPDPASMARRLRREQAAERKRRIREAKALGARAITIDNARYEFGEPARAPEADVGIDTPDELRRLV